MRRWIRSLALQALDSGTSNFSEYPVSAVGAGRLGELCQLDPGDTRATAHAFVRRIWEYLILVSLLFRHG
jgi:hypothetical protein